MNQLKTKYPAGKPKRGNLRSKADVNVLVFNFFSFCHINSKSSYSKGF